MPLSMPKAVSATEWTAIPAANATTSSTTIQPAVSACARRAWRMSWRLGWATAIMPGSIPARKADGCLRCSSMERHPMPPGMLLVALRPRV